jgi:hypothetical protein
MRIPAILAILVAVTLNHPVRADFVVRSAAPPAGSAADPDEGPGAETPAKRSSPPRFAIAYGFGKAVPLAFALRQIVPASVRITYGPGADPHAIVNWQGGRGWNRVLAAALKPLGLRPVFTRAAVEIRR